jgi:WD40 repeat protein
LGRASGSETILGRHSNSVTALAVLSDGRLASGSTGRFRDIETGQIASTSDDNMIRLWDLKSGIASAVLSGHLAGVEVLALLTDGRLASGSHDNTIRLWDIHTGAEITRLEGHVGRVMALAVMPDGRLASGSTDKTIRLWDLKLGIEIARLEVDAAVHRLAALADGGLVAGDELGRLHWLEIAS